VYNESVTTAEMSLPLSPPLSNLFSERRDMKVSEIKSQLEFFTDTLFQAGYDMGWNSVVEELEQAADREWNIGNKTTAEVLRKAIKAFRSDYDDLA
jgi:hypothetical protein